MACQGCVNRQRKIVQLLCKKPDSALCRKAKARLERMQMGATKDKMTRPEGADNTAPASDHNVE